MNWRVAFFAALMSLPALLIAGLAVWFVFTEVPGLIANEPRRVTMEYREVAEALKKNPLSAEYAGERKKSWRRQSGKIGSRPWGRVENGSAAVVWCQTDDGRFLARKVPRVDEADYALIFYAGGSVVVFALVGLTALCVVNFVGFIKKRDDFLSAAAHDLATPLVAMRYAIGRDDGEAKALTERMIRLVENIREFQRLGGRRRKPELADFDVVDAFEAAYSLFAADYRDLNGGNDIEVKYGRARSQTPDGRPKFPVRADETMVSQIIWNILSNELKYAAHEGKVSVLFCETAESVIVEFADTGPGMKPRDMKKAFNRYYRSSSARGSGKGGFGIGLCNAREFAEAMGGKLTLRANRPRGCVFTLALPAACSPVSS